MRRALGAHEAGLAALLLALLLVFWRMDPAFVSGRVQAGLLPQIGETALLAVPMTLIVVAGGIDLSVGSAMALASVSLGMAYQAGWPLEAAVALALAVGLACGALNGWATTRFRLHPLIVTLGTLSAYRGFAEGISAARPVSGFPEGFLRLGQGPLAAALFAVLSGAGSLLLARHALGRKLYGIGLGEPAARASGWDVDRIQTSLYALSGLMAGVAGGAVHGPTQHRQGGRWSGVGARGDHRRGAGRHQHLRRARHAAGHGSGACRAARGAAVRELEVEQRRAEPGGGRRAADRGGDAQRGNLPTPKRACRGRMSRWKRRR
ncbi:MAG: ABC transporter permease [Fimbriimonadales bacterium]|nr:ABC transporter permease [Fimbriimonadales bacterium]